MNKKKVNKSIYINKTLKYKTFKLWIYTYRRVIVIFSILFIISLSIGLGVGVGFFGLHKSSEKIGGIKTQLYSSDKNIVNNNFRQKNIDKNYTDKPWTYDAKMNKTEANPASSNNITFSVPDKIAKENDKIKIDQCFDDSLKRYGYNILNSTSINNKQNIQNSSKATPENLYSDLTIYMTNKSFFYNDFNKYTFLKGNETSFKQKQINTWSSTLISNIFDSLGENPTSNFLKDGDIFTLGSSACSACRDLVDIDSGSWDHVNNNPILYNYWANEGPLSNYASLNKASGFSNIFNKTWKKEPNLGETDLSSIPNWNKYLDSKDNNYFPPKFIGIKNRIQSNTSFVSGYEQPGFNADDIKGQVKYAGDNHISHIYDALFNEIDNRYKDNKSSNNYISQNASDTASWLTSQYATQITFNGSSDTLTSDKDKTPEWRKIKNMFSVNQTAFTPYKENISDAIPLVCAVHKVPVYYYGQRSGDNNGKIIRSGNYTTKLFIEQGRLNKDQLHKYLEYIYSENSGPIENDDTHCNNPFWAQDSENINFTANTINDTDYQNLLTSYLKNKKINDKIITTPKVTITNRIAVRNGNIELTITNDTDKQVFKIALPWDIMLKVSTTADLRTNAILTNAFLESGYKVTV